EHKIDIIEAERSPRFTDHVMDYGVYYSKSAGLILEHDEKVALLNAGFPADLVRRVLASTEFINGAERYCLWIDDNELGVAKQYQEAANRIESVRKDRLETKDKAVNKLASRPHQFRERKGDEAS